MTTVIDHTERGHSPLGGSGVERWTNCPGSVALLKKLDLPESDDPTYRKEGTAMHEAAELCLREGLDAWEVVGRTFCDVEIDDAMSLAVQTYLDSCRADMDFATVSGIEAAISSPVHPEFYGVTDFWALVTATGLPSARTMADPPNPGDKLIVKDLKGGEGIVVEPEDNGQLKYYAFGVIDGWEREAGLEIHPDLPVELAIVQPRAYHHTGQVDRRWTTTVGEIKAWVHNTLVPAMYATEVDDTLDPGPWCRFCPAKLICPMLTALFEAAAKADPKRLIHASDEAIARNWQYIKAVEFYLKALKEDTQRRLEHGATMDGVCKLVPKKANRVFQSTAEVEIGGKKVRRPVADLARERFGDDAFTKPELKSPAELEKLGSEAKVFVKEFAFMPQTGLTVAPWDDPKPAVRVQSTKEAFGEAIARAVASDLPLDTRPSKG